MRLDAEQRRSLAPPVTHGPPAAFDGAINPYRIRVGTASGHSVSRDVTECCNLAAMPAVASKWTGFLELMVVPLHPGSMRSAHEIAQSTERLNRAKTIIP
jgi:hypothetical protein